MNNARKAFSKLNGKQNVTGANISHYRLLQNLSAQQLSDKLMLLGLDLHRQAIYDIESR